AWGRGAERVLLGAVQGNSACAGGSDACWGASRSPPVGRRPPNPALHLNPRRSLRCTGHWWARWSVLRSSAMPLAAAQLVHWAPPDPVIVTIASRVRLGHPFSLL